MRASRLHGAAPRSRGMILITSLLLLVVVTLLALAMFHGVGLEYRIAGNNMDKQRSLQAAESAQEYGEQWLIANAPQDYGAAEIWGIPCIAGNFTTATTPVMCSNSLESTLSGGNVGAVPWGGAGSSLGVSYNPGGDLTASTSGGQNTVAQLPVVYISRLGFEGASSVDFTVDAWSFGGSSSTVSVVESVYRVTYISSCGGCP
ncbi:MAG TPA: PilX N-terminal domain-containing pilus assembly protein [Steroidobacteraceae bacterium]